MNEITINEQCIHCGLCVKVCPAKVFEPTDNKHKPAITNAEACIACGHCEAVCTTDAVMSSPFQQKGQTTVLDNSVESTLCSLRSIRHYSHKPINETDLTNIIQAGFNAPTAQNIREVSINVFNNNIDELNNQVLLHFEKMTKIVSPLVLKFISLINKKKGDALKSTMFKLNRVITSTRQGHYHIFHKAPHVIVIHAHKSNRFAKDDCDAALNHMRIAAHSKGYGSCIIGFAMSAQSSVHKELNLPKENKIYGVLSLGKPTIKYCKGITRNVK